MIEEIGLAGARVPQGGEKSGEAYPEGGLPIDDAITYANGFVMSSSKDGGGLLIGEGLAARRDEGFGAVDPDILGKQARDQSGDGRGRTHDDVVVPVHTTNGVEACACAGGFGKLMGAVAGDHGAVCPEEEGGLNEAFAATTCAIMSLVRVWAVAPFGSAENATESNPLLPC